MTDLTTRLGGAKTELAFKAPCRVATTANITLSGYQTINGVTFASTDVANGYNTRILVKNQTTATQNGIYVVSDGTWQRARDFDGNSDIVKGTRVYVQGGTVGATTYVVTTADPIVIDTSSITFVTEQSLVGAGVGFEFDGGGAPLVVGQPGYQAWRRMPFPGTITQNTMLADLAGTMVIKIYKDTYCVDAETECLTRRGWKRYDEVDWESDDILAFSTDSMSTRWERPTGRYEDSYAGEMIHIGGRSSRINALVTPNHSWPVIPLRGSAEVRFPIERYETRHLPKKCLLLRSAPHEAPSEPMHDDALVRVAAWYFTEGASRSQQRILSITQSQKVNPDNCAAIRADLHALGATWNAAASPHVGKPSRGVGAGRGTRRRKGLWAKEWSRSDGTTHFTLTGDVVDTITAVVCGKDKVPTPEFLTALTAHQLVAFVETCLLGDGAKHGRIFYQHNKERMDAFVMAATLAGYSPSLDSTGTVCSLRRTRAYTWWKDTPKSTVNYEGIVWCPTLPSGYWVARRAGKIFITGNSNYPPVAADSIVASAPPTLTAAVKSVDTTLTGWTVDFALGDILLAEITSTDGIIKKVVLDLLVDRSD